MGAASARCCSVEVTHHVGAGKSAPSTPSEIPGIKSSKQYKSTYKESEANRKPRNVTFVKKIDSGLKYALRRIPKETVPCKDRVVLEKHLINLNGLEHPHLCKFVEAFEDGECYYLIYERGEQKSLFDHIRERDSFLEEDGADFTRQIAMALALAHSQNVVHGCLSPSSLILALEDEEEGDDDLPTQVKVCDMGQAFFLRPTVLECGKDDALPYVAPEVAWEELKSKPGTTPKDSDKLDIWGLGAIVYHMLTGTAPFAAHSQKELINKIQTQAIEYRDVDWSELSPDAREAVEGMLKLNSRLRLSAAALLKHPWIRLTPEKMPKKRLGRLLQNLKFNVSQGYFKQMVLRVIAEQLPKDGRQLETIEKAFRILDRNGDGVLTIKELANGLRKYPELGRDDLDALFAQLDRDGSGTVNVVEFASATVDQSQVNSLPNLWQAFNAFDKDRSGAIALDEIEQIIRGFEGGLLPREQLDQLCSEVRQELQGLEYGNQIDFDQFVYIMSVPSGQPDLAKSLKKDLYRCLWCTVGMDCTQVRKSALKNWDYTVGASPRSPRSVYRRATREDRQERRDRRNVR